MPIKTWQTPGGYEIAIMLPLLAQRAGGLLLVLHALNAPKVCKVCTRAVPLADLVPIPTRI